MFLSEGPLKISLCCRATRIKYEMYMKYGLIMPVFDRPFCPFRCTSGSKDSSTDALPDRSIRPDVLGNSANARHCISRHPSLQHWQRAHDPSPHHGIPHQPDTPSAAEFTADVGKDECSEQVCRLGAGSEWSDSTHIPHTLIWYVTCSGY